MARFIFQLEPLLEFRRETEKSRQRELASASAGVVHAERQLADVHRQMEVALEEMRAHHLTGRLDLGFLAAHRRFVIAMQRQAGDARAALEVARQAETAARAQLAAAAVERKVIEKLREKHHERWQQALDRRENAQIDEIGMQLAYRNTAAAHAAQHAADDAAGDNPGIVPT